MIAPPPEIPSQTAPPRVFLSLKERLKQFSHEWDLPPEGHWLAALEIAHALRVSRRHVLSLIQEGSFDCAIDLRAPDAAQPYWRVWRASFLRFGQRARGEPSGRFRLEVELADALAPLPLGALSVRDVSAHFRCSKQHIYNLAPLLANVGAGDAARALVRVSKAELLALIKERMV